jgi:hypothetical protein
MEKVQTFSKSMSRGEHERSSVLASKVLNKKELKSFI